MAFPATSVGSTLLFACVILAATACGAHITPMQPRSPSVEIVPVSPPSSFVSDSAYFVANPLMVPVLGIVPRKVPDTFKASRDGGERVHHATDILAPKGTPVLAATAGKILRMSKNHLGGITIYMLDEHTRFLYYYAHLDHYSDQISPGASVSQGEVLGYVGMTGNAPVTHLHFQAMRWNPHRRDYWNCDPVDVRQFFTLQGNEEDAP